MCQTVILLTATLALLSGQAFAQSVPQNCSAVTGIDWKNETLVGNWLELARNPGNNTNACLEFRTGLLANGSLSINATHSSSPTSTYQNVDQPQVIVNLNGSTTGYNVSLTEGQLVHINLLEVVNNATYILGCGYTNATDNSTSFGFILGRADKYNATGLKLANDEAALKYSNFNSSYATILQQGCTRNSASQSLPLISGFVALALLLIKAH